MQWTLPCWVSLSVQPAPFPHALDEATTLGMPPPPRGPSGTGLFPGPHSSSCLGCLLSLCSSLHPEAALELSWPGQGSSSLELSLLWHFITQTFPVVVLLCFLLSS